MLKSARSSPSDSAGLTQVVLASRGVLVTWAAFCLIHHEGMHDYPLLRDFAVAPNFCDLEHLVLEDATSVATLLHVCAYVRAAARSPTRSAVIFSGRVHERAGTDALADAVAAADPKLVGLWKDEQAHALTRETTRYSQIQKQQAECAQLRARLVVVERKELEVRERLEKEALRAYDAARPSGSASCEHLALLTARERTRSQLSIVTALDSKLQTALIAPPLLRQPLPSDQTLGPRAVFHTHMPLPPARLARWSFECYEVLLDETRWPRLARAKLAERFELPKAPDVHGKEACLAYHDKHNPVRKASTPLSLLRLGCWDAATPADNSITHSKSVDTIGNSSNGVFHPMVSHCAGVALAE